MTFIYLGQRSNLIKFAPEKHILDPYMDLVGHIWTKFGVGMPLDHKNKHEKAFLNIHKIDFYPRKEDQVLQIFTPLNLYRIKKESLKWQ